MGVVFDSKALPSLGFGCAVHRTVPCISLGEGFLQVFLQRLPQAGDLPAALRHIGTIRNIEQSERLDSTILSALTCSLLTQEKERVSSLHVATGLL